MPIYEFKCLKCDNFFELLIMSGDDEVKMQCPKCNAQEFERVLSTTNYSMGYGASPSKGVSTESRSCSSGSCTTYDIPGPAR